MFTLSNNSITSHACFLWLKMQHDFVSIHNLLNWYESWNENNIMWEKVKYQQAWMNIHVNTASIHSASSVSYYRHRPLICTQFYWFTACWGSYLLDCGIEAFTLERVQPFIIPVVLRFTLVQKVYDTLLHCKFLYCCYLLLAFNFFLTWIFFIDSDRYHINCIFSYHQVINHKCLHKTLI